MVIGLDAGYFNTKWHTEDDRGIFTSVVKEGVDELNYNTHVVYDGKPYTVGGDMGFFSSESDKTFDTTFKICTYTGIGTALSNSHDYSVKLVTGLPVSYYSKQKDNLVQELKNSEVDITINDKLKHFFISDVVVFPQSAGVFLLHPEKFRPTALNLIIDIGGFTVDVSLFKGMNLVKYRTFRKGILTLYSEIRHYLSTLGYDLDLFDIRRILSENNIDFLAKSDMANITDTCKSYIKDLYNNIKINFTQYDYSNHIYIGGGSVDLKSYIDADIEEDTIFTNAEAFYKVGTM